MGGDSAGRGHGPDLSTAKQVGATVTHGAQGRQGELRGFCPHREHRNSDWDQQTRPVPNKDVKVIRRIRKPFLIVITSYSKRG